MLLTASSWRLAEFEEKKQSIENFTVFWISVLPQWFLKSKGDNNRILDGKWNVLFNDARNTFYLRLYGVGHMVKDHSDSERGNPLPPHGLLFPINSKASFICTIPQTG